MSGLEILQIEVGLLANFCEVIGCVETGCAALVDPAFEVDRLVAEAERRGWKIETILLTHTHADHIAGLDEAVQRTGATVYCHPVEVAVASEQAADVQPVENRQQVSIGNYHAQAIYTPGHTPGCICWYLEEADAVITGDVLFVGSCGKIGNAQGAARAMYDSLYHQLGALPEHTRLYPGHDYGPTPMSTLSWEYTHNRVLQAADYDEFAGLVSQR